MIWRLEDEKAVQKICLCSATASFCDLQHYKVDVIGWTSIVTNQLIYKADKTVIIKFLKKYSPLQIFCSVKGTSETANICFTSETSQMVQLEYLGFLGLLNCRKADGQESLTLFLTKVCLTHGFPKHSPQVLAFLQSISRRRCVWGCVSGKPKHEKSH